MKNIITAFCLSVLLGLALTSCQDDKKPSSNDDIFAFETTRSVNLDVDFKFAGDHRAYYEAYTEMPYTVDEQGNYEQKEDLSPIVRGYTDSKGSISIKLTVPTYASAIYIYSPDALAPTYTEYALEGSYNSTKYNSKATLKKNNRKIDYSNWEQEDYTFVYKPKYAWAGRPEGIINGGFWFESPAPDIINATIGNNKTLDVKYKENGVIEILKECNLTLRYQSTKTQRKNGIAFYVYTGEKPSRDYINSHLNLVYPDAHNQAVAPGEGMLMKYAKADGSITDVFPAGAKVGFVLLSDLWNEEVNDIRPQAKLIYSEKEHNNYTIEGVSQQNHMAAFIAGKYLVLSFEDFPYSPTATNGSTVGDFCDNIFALQSSVEGAFSPSIPAGVGGQQQPDYVTEIKQFGTLAFEDVWPYKGDYDMNDVVVEYQLSDWLNQDNYITRVTGVFTFKYTGAAYKDGFGFELPTVTTDNVKSCMVESDYSCTGQGLDNTMAKATVMIFDEGISVPAGTEFKVTVEFNNPVSLSNYRKAPYNPFITVGAFLEQNRKEVHLVNYMPTPKMDNTLLHFGHDLSVPEKGIYYVSDADYPFALNIPILDFVIPQELENIGKVYPHYNEWVESHGERKADWYKYPNK